MSDAKNIAPPNVQPQIRQPIPEEGKKAPEEGKHEGGGEGGAAKMGDIFKGRAKRNMSERPQVIKGVILETVKAKLVKDHITTKSDIRRFCTLRRIILSEILVFRRRLPSCSQISLI